MHLAHRFCDGDLLGLAVQVVVSRLCCGHLVEERTPLPNELRLQVLQRLAEHGNTLLVIEHNLDVIKTADWVIDLGPEGGAGGGQLLATGTPEQIANSTISHTGVHLARIFARDSERD